MYAISDWRWCRFSMLLVFLAVHIPPTAGRAEEPDRPRALNRSFPSFSAVEVPLDVANFGEGWKASLTYPDQMSGATCRLWVEDGWLHATRVSDIGVEWRLTLAPVIEGMVPQAAQYPGRPAIEVSYADGQYFIRDNSVVLRALRSRSEQARPTFSLADVSEAKFTPSGSCGTPESGFVVAGLSDGTWHCVTSGSSRDNLDGFILLNLVELLEPGQGQGFTGMMDGLRQAHHGDRWAFDDGELLIAYYMNPVIGGMKISQKKVRENIVGAVLPEIEAVEWFNVDKPLSRDDLKGKVVLLDFWATTCGPCIKKLPDIQSLYDKYAKEGLVVIALHSADDSGSCKKFVKDHEFSFPFALDSGNTVRNYGVSSNPSYFLISREGKVVNGHDPRLPSASEIELLLKQ